MFYFLSFASLSFCHLSPIPALSPLASLRSLPGLPCHSPIALRPLSCNSCRLQLCTSFLCSLLVRYRYRFSLSLSVSLTLFLSTFPFMFKAALHAGCSSVHSHHYMDLGHRIFHLASHCNISPLTSLRARTCHPVWRIGTVYFNACVSGM